MKQRAHRSPNETGQRPHAPSRAWHRAALRRHWFRVAVITVLVLGLAVFIWKKSSPSILTRKGRVIDTNTPPVPAELKARPVQPQTLAELLVLPPGQLEHVDLAVLNRIQPANPSVRGRCR